MNSISAISNFEDLVQYHNGFKPRLIGTAEQIARRIQEYEAVGVDILLGDFLPFIEDVEQFTVAGAPARSQPTQPAAPG